jgi:dolichol-phosphate mannosyltransferase
MNNVLICPIAYNENIKLKSAIGRFLKSTVCGKVDYLIIDDGSTDGTAEMIAGFAAQGVETIKQPARQGVGAAIRTAIKYAREKNYEVIVIMAGNNKDNPDEIPNLIDPIFEEGCDLVQGSRYLKGIRIGGDMPFYRKVATKLHPFILSCIVKKHITDSTNGFRAIRLSVFEDQRIDIYQDWLNKYELEPYILFKVLTLGYNFKEVSVTKIYPAKHLGYTKMQPFIGWWSILRPLIYLSLGIKK